MYNIGIVHSYVAIVPFLSNTNVDDYSEEKYTKAIKERVHELGLDKLVSDKGYDSGLKPWEYQEELEKNLLDKSPKIQWKLGKFNNHDLVNAVNYLEVFLFLTVQEVAASDKGIKSKKELIKFQKKCGQSVKILEDIGTIAKSNSKDLQKLLTPKVKTFERKFNKILAENVSLSHQLLYLKDINRALKILNKMSGS